MDTKEIMKRYDEGMAKYSDMNDIANAVIASSGINAILDKSIVARVNVLQEARRKEIKRQNCIRENVCPICSGKLTRGKRNKNNDYKRGWVCNTCSAVHHI